ncbi:lipase/esterase family protein [Diplocarpon mali]|nr:lipase/esterase family protein [Diplocarpon mali]
MVFNTVTVGGAVTPAVIRTFLSHYLNRKPLAQKPTAHISYDEGLHLIRKFLLYASYHTVEDIQRFTSQWVPHPRWVKVDEVKISEEYTNKAAEHIQEQLGHHGIKRVGGKTWWQWRRSGSEVEAEWIEMRSDYNERKVNKDTGKRVMLYVHGGAYFFGSVDEHRYQMQRHARKLKARVLARVAGDNPLDYIPPYGFHQKPSPSWPPPNSDDLRAIEEGIVENFAKKGQDASPPTTEGDAVQGFHIDHNPPPETRNKNATRDSSIAPVAETVSGPGHSLSIMIEGKLVEIKDQIQMYASNQLISHPLVSPILQPSLGGLPPLLILTGGGEMLRDEQIYLAHKAANPTKYAPGDAFLNESPSDHNKNQVNRWKPTNVQLQVWDDLCHVAPTLSFTRPAKYMYRSIAQFGAWTLARAQKTEIEILDDDDVSVISQSESDEGADTTEQKEAAEADRRQASGQVGKAGDPLPPFNHHMIRQRVDRHGDIFDLEPESELPACNLPTSEIGVIKEGPVKKWMAAKSDWDTKFASAKRKVQKQRVKEYGKGYGEFGNGEVPPPSALAGRRNSENLKEAKKSRSYGMSLWSLWGSKHDEKTIILEKEADNTPNITIASAGDGAGERPLNDTRITQTNEQDKGQKPTYSRSKSRRRAVTDQNQTGNLDVMDENISAYDSLAIQTYETGIPREVIIPEFTTKSFSLGFSPGSSTAPPATLKQSRNEEYDLKRPKADGIAFPFSLKGYQTTASMTTLTSAIGVSPAMDVRTSGAYKSGVPHSTADFEAVKSTGNSSNEMETSREVEQVNSIDQGNVGAVKSNSEGKGKGKVVENGEVTSDERPAMQTFFTAPDIPALIKGAQS